MLHTHYRIIFSLTSIWDVQKKNDHGTRYTTKAKMIAVDKQSNNAKLYLYILISGTMPFKKYKKSSGSSYYVTEKND